MKARPKQIRYGIDRDTGMVVSQRLDTDEYAWPVILFDQIGKDGDFTGPLPVELVKLGRDDFYTHGYSRYADGRSTVRWTRKIPTEIKNVHRAFWGMAPLKERP